MFVKHLFQKGSQSQPPQHNVAQGGLASADLEPHVVLHYGIPSSASVLAFDPIQHLLAIGTLDGRIKVIGGDNIEALLISSKQLPFKNLEFMQNQGFLASVSNENDIQVWDLKHRCIASTLLWDSNITAFSVIHGTNYIYIGDEHGFLSVLKYDAEEGKLLRFPYRITESSIAEAAGISLTSHHSVVGVLPQPYSHGNRVLIAYENGLIILWDVFEGRAILVKGYRDLQLKDEAMRDSAKDISHEFSDDASDHEQYEKDISSLCWMASDGSILAVGYVDGDIMLWNLSTAASVRDQQAEISSHNVVKLQLSSGNRKLPVIVLHWKANTHNDHGGQLFVYGGDEIGSDEVLTILTLDWSSEIETVKCVGRVDLKLNGSFADMILLPNAGAVECSHASLLIVLTNPGKLHVYDDACLSALISQHEKMSAVPAVQYPMVIPTVEPYMTVGKLSAVHTDETFSKDLFEIVSAGELQVLHNQTAVSMKWPVTGGVPSQLSSAKEDWVKRIYIAGYQDGSVRIWDATYPTMSLIFLITPEVQGIIIAGSKASVSALEFFSMTLTLAIGNECGLVRLYKLVRSYDETSLHFVTKTEREVHNLHQGIGAQCTAIFSLLNSPVRTLQFANFGKRLAIGFESGQVAMLDIALSSVMFITDTVSGSSSPVISLAVDTLSDTHSLKRPKNPESENWNNLEKWIVFFLTTDGHFGLIDGSTGDMISSQPIHPIKDSGAISMYILEDISVSEVSGEKHSLNLSHKNELKDESADTNFHSESNLLEADRDISMLGQRLIGLNVLLCYEEALCLYSLKSLIQGDSNSIQRVNLVKPCSWTTTILKDEECGLVVFYQNGIVEIRSLPDLEMVGESSLMSLLRWNLKTDMHKLMSSSNSGQITMVNGFEFAIISLLASGNDFRIPESLPFLHDEVLAAAASSAVNFSPNQNKQQGTAPRILGGLIKGFKGGKEEHNLDLTEARKSDFGHLESIFSGFPNPSTADTASQEVVELSIDDIDIDEPVVLSSSNKSKSDERGKETEREKLFEGATSDTNPRLRTAAEIKAKYRKAGDASQAAADARDKLVQRQDKLERLSRRTEELQSGAENFASMANELVKTMEKRKWWNL